MTTSAEVYGWKDIAAKLGRSIIWAQRQAKRNIDPVPVRVGHRGVYANICALRDWADRQDMAYTTHRRLERLQADANGRMGAEYAEE